jgi:hypothetical protein
MAQFTISFRAEGLRDGLPPRWPFGDVGLAYLAFLVTHRFSHYTVQRCSSGTDYP